MKIRLYNGCTSGLSLTVDSTPWVNLSKKDKLSVLLSMLNTIDESSLSLYAEYLSYDVSLDKEEYYDCEQCGDSSRLAEITINERLQL